MKRILKFVILFSLLSVFLLFIVSCNKFESNSLSVSEATTTSVQTTQNESAEATECVHNYISASVPPSAKENGGIKHICSKCGDWYLTDVITPISFTVTA